MILTSRVVADRDTMPIRYTCEGANISPPLSWTEVPAGTRSFAIVMADPDASGQTWYHWAMWDIPGDLTGIDEDYSVLGPYPQGTNDFHKQGWNGPCPPSGHGTHRHRFTLYALRVDHLGISPVAHCREVEAAADRVRIAKAELTVMFRR